MWMSFQEADFGALTALWNSHCPEKYRIDEELLRLNSVQNELFDWGASTIVLGADGPVGFTIVKKSAAGLYGSDQDIAHLSAVVFSDCNHGVDVMARTKRLLRQRGIYELVFGQDSGHFFPGCPYECKQLQDFLMVEGFEPAGDQVDLTRNLADYEMPARAAEGLAQPGVAVRPIQMSDATQLESFMREEFDGRWRYDLFRKIRGEGRSDFVHGLFIDGQLLGFALTQDATHRLPIAGAIWRNSLGTDWCTLGPIGVSRSLRGTGLGNALLGGALAHLRDQGKQNCLIDWTTLVSFYGQHGFQVTNRYITFKLKLDQPNP